MGCTMGEPPPARHVNMPSTIIHIHPFRVLHHFECDRSTLRPLHLPLIQITAQHIVASWHTPQPLRTIRLVSDTDPIGPEPSNIELGPRRALEAQPVLLDAIERLRPGLSRQSNIVPQHLGESRPAARDRTPEARASHRRVELCLATMAAAPTPLAPLLSPVQPPPPAPARPGRLPTPAEAARAVVPLGPETPEERIGRSLTPPPPTPPPRRSFSEMFWRRMEASLHAPMSRVGVPPSLRGPIRDAAHAAIRQGGEGLWNRARDATGRSSEAQEARHAAGRAAAQTPIRCIGDKRRRTNMYLYEREGVGQLPTTSQPRNRTRRGYAFGPAPRAVEGFGQPRPPTQPPRPVFEVQCPAGCPPVAAAQCRTVVRQAIIEAIKLANNAASKLKAATERKPDQRDAETRTTAKLFKFFFGHDPSTLITGADNKASASGASVAYRFQMVARELGGGRRIVFRCLDTRPDCAPSETVPNPPCCCPGQDAFIFPWTAPNVVHLCAQFWNPPAVLGLPPPFYRAAVIMHEMLHLLFIDFLLDVGRGRRSRVSCYEAFALRVAEFGADPFSVCNCMDTPCPPDPFPPCPPVAG
jgi:hypothetical protein